MSLLALGALAASLSVAPAEPAAPFRGGVSGVVLITLDTTRADRVGASRGKASLTPALDALAARGTRFTRCDATAVVTLPSHASILTGLLPRHHGVRDNGGFSLPASVPTLATALSSAGWDTAAVLGSVVLARGGGLERGFRVYDDDLGAGYARGTVVAERPASEVTAAALRVLPSLRAPFLLWVHYYDPHEEYHPPPGFVRGTGAAEAYDGEVSFVDQEVGKLLAALPAGSLVAAVGDHGEMLGEHGERTHGILPFGAARRVPLILAGPGIPAGLRQDCLVSTLDLAPTLLELTGRSPLPGIDGRSLRTLLRGPARCDRVTVCESQRPLEAFGWHPLTTVSTDRWLLVHGRTDELFDLAADPGEKRDVAAGNRRVVGQLRKHLSPADASAHSAAKVALDEERRRALGSLGYLSGAGRTEASRDLGKLPDPRGMTDVLQALERATELVREGRCAEALPRLDEVLRRSPSALPALLMSGRCARAVGDVDGALERYRRARSLAPRDAAARTGEADCLARLGQREAAAIAFREAIALEPAGSEAPLGLAQLLSGSGDLPRAREVLAAAVAAGCRNPAVLRERGILAEAQGDLAGAEAAFAAAARRNPTDPELLERTAAVILLRGRPGEAALVYERLVRLVPNRSDVWSVLGAIYLDRLGRTADAARCLRNAYRLAREPGERRRLERLLHDLDGR